LKKIAIIIVKISMLFLSVNFYELYELIYADHIRRSACLFYVSK